jgi:ABC-type polysaccharide/polyol phosphate export permease
MGLFWNVLNPLAMLVLYTFVFSVILKVKFGEDATTGNFALYLFCGMVPWLAFSDAVDRSTRLIMRHQNLVKKTVFPLEILPCYTTVSSLVTECVSLAILMVAVILMLGKISMHLVLLPVLLVLQTFFALGFALFFSSICVFFRDIMHFVGLMLLAWMFATPIMYPESLYPDRLRFLVWGNPMALLVGMFRDVVLNGTTPPLWEMGLFFFWTAVVFYLGLFFFDKTKSEFADVI